MDDAVLKRLDQPDESRRFEKGCFDLVRLGAATIGRARYEPGWRWSEHVGAAAGQKLCDVEHVGLVLRGHAKVRMQDGREIDLKAGDCFWIGPGHDSWVVGQEPYESLHLGGSEAYAAGRPGPAGDESAPPARRTSSRTKAGRGES